MKRHFAMIKFIQLLFILGGIGVTTNAHGNCNSKHHLTYVFFSSWLYVIIINDVYFVVYFQTQTQMLLQLWPLSLQDHHPQLQVLALLIIPVVLATEVITDNISSLASFSATNSLIFTSMTAISTTVPSNPGEIRCRYSLQFVINQ